MGFCSIDLHFCVVSITFRRSSETAEFLDQFGKCAGVTKDNHRGPFVRDDGFYQINTSDPDLEPPAMTWREFLEQYRPYTPGNPEGEWAVPVADLDRYVDPGLVIKSRARIQTALNLGN